ncbi:MAG: hypothetical protein V3R71_08770, partial [Gemmatimonadales bacterium]
RTWAFKHPTPADFFRLMSDASGTNLDWFWRNWIYTTARLDQAVDSVAGENGTNVYLSNRGQMVMPVELTITYQDGSSETIRLPVEMWNQGPRFTYRAAAGRRITGAEVDPRGALPDVDRENNRWPE